MKLRALSIVALLSIAMVMASGLAIGTDNIGYDAGFRGQNVAGNNVEGYDLENQMAGPTVSPVPYLAPPYEATENTTGFDIPGVGPDVAPNATARAPEQYPQDQYGKYPATAGRDFQTEAGNLREKVMDIKDQMQFAYNDVQRVERQLAYEQGPLTENEIQSSLTLIENVRSDLNVWESDVREIRNKIDSLRNDIGRAGLTDAEAEKIRGDLEYLEFQMNQIDRIASDTRATMERVDGILQERQS